MDAQDASAELERRLSELESLALWLDDQGSASRAARLRRLLAAVAELREQESAVVPAQRTPRSGA